jgi:hypothetical protein
MILREQVLRVDVGYTYTEGLFGSWFTLIF